MIDDTNETASSDTSQIIEDFRDVKREMKERNVGLSICRSFLSLEQGRQLAKSSGGQWLARLM